MLILVYSAMYTFEGALEKILAEEHCYPQFHAKYFMSKWIVLSYAVYF